MRFRCWRGGCRCEWVRKPEIRTKMHHIAMQHMEKENRRKPSVFAGFVAGAEGLGLGCRLGCCSPVGSAQHRPRREPRPVRGRAPLALAHPTTRTAGGPAGAPRCQILPHTNEKSQVPHKRYLTFLAGAEGLEPSARGFGVDVGKCVREQGRAGVTRFPPQAHKRPVLIWCCEEILRDKDGKNIFFLRTVVLSNPQ